MDNELTTEEQGNCRWVGPLAGSLVLLGIILGAAAIYFAW
jgi:hypothetical protein